MMAYLLTTFFSGQRLPAIAEDVEVYIAQILHYSMSGSKLNSVALLRRCSLTLLNEEGGEQAIGRDVMLEGLDGLDNYASSLAHLFQGSLHYFFGQHEKGAALAEKTGIMLKNFLSLYASMPSLYQQCLCLYASAQHCNNVWQGRKRRRLGRQRHEILKGWAKDGCVNVVHYVAILDAELAILNKAPGEKVQYLYQKAIALSARGGMVHDLAVVTERLAIYLNSQGELVEAGRRYEQASQYYQEWGFTWKSKYIQREFADLILSWSLSNRGT